MKTARHHQTRQITTALSFAIASLIFCLQLTVFTPQGQAESVDLTKVSVGLGGAATNRSSSFPQISADGRFVAFESTASNLVAGDDNNSSDVFLRDQSNGMTTLVSKSRNGNGASADDTSYQAAISATGRYIVFVSSAGDLVARNVNNNKYNIYRYDRDTDITTLVSITDRFADLSNGDSYNPQVTPDGRYVVYESYASNLVDDDQNGSSDIFRIDLQAGRTSRASVSTNEAQGNDHSNNPQITPNGRYIVFQSEAVNLVAGIDANNAPDVFLRDTQLDETFLISVGRNGRSNRGNYNPQVTPDIHYVVFETDASNLVDNDNNGRSDILVRDLRAGGITRVSVDSNGAQSNSGSYSPQITDDGRRVIFQSHATNLVAGDVNGKFDIFSHDQGDNKTSLVSAKPDGTQANNHSYHPQVTPDGRFVVYESDATNLTADPYIAGFSNIFLRDNAKPDPELPQPPPAPQPPAPPQPSAPPQNNPTPMNKPPSKSAYKKACKLKLTSPRVRIRGGKSRRGKVSRKKARRLFTHGSKGQIKWGKVQGKQVKCKKIRMLLLEKRGKRYYIPGTKIRVSKKSLAYKRFAKTLRKLRKKKVGTLRLKSRSSKKQTKFSYKNYNRRSKLGRSALRKLRSKRYRGTFVVVYTAEVSGVKIKNRVKLTSR